MEPDEKKAAHLAMIQGVVSRMGANACAVKTWAVAIIAALFALAVSQSKPEPFFGAILPLLVFWWMDAYYLRQERLYRHLYDDVRHGNELKAAGAFSMNTEEFEAREPWSSVLRSKTEAPFYGLLILLALGGGIFLH